VWVGEGRKVSDMSSVVAIGIAVGWGDFLTRCDALCAVARPGEYGKLFLRH